jgi:hypothetical protein
MQLQKQMQGMDALKNFTMGGQGVTPDAARAGMDAGATVGDIGPTQTNLARAQKMAGTGAPPNFGALVAAGVAPEVVKTLMEDWKLRNPEAQIHGGYAIPTMRGISAPTLLPSINTSQSGQTSMITPSAGGQPVVSAPQGALDTFGKYQNASEEAKAKYDLVTTPPLSPNLPPTRGSRLDALGLAVPRPQTPSLEEILRGRPQAEQDAIRRLSAAGNTPTTIRGVPTGNESTGAPLTGELPPANAAGMSPNQSEFVGTVNKNDADYLKNLREGADSAVKGKQGIDFMKQQIASGAMGGRLAPGFQAAGEFLLGMHVPLPDSVQQALRSGQNFNKTAQEAALSQLKFYVGAQNISDADRNAVMALAPRLQDDPKARLEWIDFIDKRLSQQLDKFKSADSYANQRGTLRGWSYMPELDQQIMTTKPNTNQPTSPQAGTWKVIR